VAQGRAAVRPYWARLGQRRGGDEIAGLTGFDAADAWVAVACTWDDRALGEGRKPLLFPVEHVVAVGRRREHGLQVIGLEHAVADQRPDFFPGIGEVDDGLLRRPLWVDEPRALVVLKEPDSAWREIVERADAAPYQLATGIGFARARALAVWILGVIGALAAV